MKIEIPLKKSRFAKLEDPAGKGHDKYFALVAVKDLPELPTEINPRMQDTRSRVARDIANGLLADSEVFHILNRGITLTAKSVEAQSGNLILDFGNGENYGAIDGGHTYAVIKENLDKEPDAFVQLEVITNVKNSLVVDVARARNTSAQVHDESLANLQGSFEWIKEALAKYPFADKIAYRENEDDKAKPIDVREIIALMTMYHPLFLETENPPVIAYANKGACLKMFVESTYEDGYLKLRNILPDILRLYDFIHARFADIYQNMGGFSALDEEKKHTGATKLSKVVEVKTLQRGFPLYYLTETEEIRAFYRFPDGWLFPVVAALRSLVSYKHNAKWKTDPYKFFERHGKTFVSQTLEASKSLGRSPNAVGKNKAHWVYMHEKANSMFARMLGVDLDREIAA